MKMATSFSMKANLSSLISRRDEFIKNPGTDPDYDGILDALGRDDDGNSETTEELNAKWFDHVASLLQEKSATGHIKVYRRISVENIDDFLASIQNTSLGSSWSWDEDSASCEYHPEANHDHEILLTALAPLDSILWDDTMVQHFGHPHEREIVVEGKVVNLTVEYDDNIIHQVPTAEA